MGNKLVRWFNVMISIILPLQLILQAAHARFETMLGHEDTPDSLKLFLNFAPSEKRDALVLMALSTLTAGLAPEFALEYAIGVVNKGEGITPYLQYLQKLVHVDFKGMDFDVRPDSSVDEFLNAMAATIPEAAEAIRVDRAMMRDAEVKPFNVHRKEVATVIENYLDHEATIAELELIQARVEQVELVQDKEARPMPFSINFHDMGVTVDGDGLSSVMRDMMARGSKGKVQ